MRMLKADSKLEEAQHRANERRKRQAKAANEE